MAATYCTEAQVVSTLGLVDEDGNRVILSTDTIPTLAEITEEIEEVESEINNYCNTNWYGTTTVTNEYHSSYFMFTQRRLLDGVLVQLAKQYVQSITTVEYWDGSNWITLSTEGSGPGDGDYYVDFDNGIVWINNNIGTTSRENNIRVTYTHGRTSVPKAIQRATRYLTAASIFSSGMDWVNDLVETDDAMNHNQKVKYWTETAYAILDRHIVSPQFPQF